MRRRISCARCGQDHHRERRCRAFGGAGHQTVLILDFGGQYTQLIARRVRENRVYCEIHPFDLPLDEIRRRRPIGLILSGGPQCVLDPGAPSAPAELFALGIEAKHSQPYHPQTCGKVERFHQTMKKFLRPKACAIQPLAQSTIELATR